MSRRFKNSIGPIIGYHGCRKDFAEEVLSGSAIPEPRPKEYDWLGPGVYYWADSPERAADWALEQKKRCKGSYETGIFGAYIHLGLCLNLTDYGVLDEVKKAYEAYKIASESAGVPLAVNKRSRDGIHTLRPLDCAVIKTLHDLRKKHGLEPYDTVYGVFEEGAKLFDGSGFKSKTHIQVAVINPDCVLGYFRVRS